MENNLEAFVKLKQDYEIIAEELESQYDLFIGALSFLKKRTGFGSTQSCTLCVAAEIFQRKTKCIRYCKYCMWDINSGEAIAPCVTNNYSEIYSCMSTHQLANLLRKRVVMMEKQIRISQG